MINEHFYEKLLDHLYDGVYYVDKDRTILYWSKGAERITGYSAGEVVGSRCFDNILNHRDYEGCPICLEGCPLHKTIDDGEIREGEVYLHHKEGHRVPVSIKTVSIEENGERVGAVEIFSDNTRHVEMVNHIESLQNLAMTDELTGLPNRRYVEAYIESKMKEYVSLGIPFGVVLFDIDDFKVVNDRYGHEVGDRILQLLARTSQNILRKTDIIGRWGGEEFVGVFVNVDYEDMVTISEKLRLLIAGSSIRLDDGHALSVTVSIGGTLVSPDNTMKDLVGIADHKMYQSKVNGKNCVTL